MIRAEFCKSRSDFDVYMTLQVDKGVHVLVGESGSGKTTALQVLAGIITPEQGRIQFDNITVFDSQSGVNIPSEERHVGYVPQGYTLFPHLNVWHNIAFGIPSGQRDGDEIVRELAASFHITDILDQPVTSLSGGQAQRVALARALAVSPKLLLLDEPLSALDVRTKVCVRNELKRYLTNLQIPVILVTHDFDDARVLGDFVGVIQHGCMIQQGTVKQLEHEPINGFVAQLVGCNWTSTGTGKATVCHAFHPADARIGQRKEPGCESYVGIVDSIVRRDRHRETCVAVGNEMWRIEEAWHDELAEIAEGDAVCVNVPREFVRSYHPAGVEPAGFRPELRSDASVRTRIRFSRILGVVSAGVVGIGGAIGVASAAVHHNHQAQVMTKTVLTAFVAANAQDPINAAVKAFEAVHPRIVIQTSFAGTQILQTQMEHGADVDFFLSADKSHMEALKKAGYVSQYYAVSKNREVLIVPKGNPGHIQSLKDLQRKGTKLIIGVPAVPVGSYARTIFHNANALYGAGFSSKVQANVVSEETDVKEILAKVATGSAQAGIVYRTDVTPDFADKVTIIPIPASVNVVSTNYIAIPTHSKKQHDADDFLQYLLSPAGQHIFDHYGYIPALHSVKTGT